MKDQKKIRLGLIGVGNWALFAHVRVLRLLPEYEIVAIYSQRKEAAKAAATEYGIPHVAESLDALVRDPLVDQVLVLTTSQHRAVKRVLRLLKIGQKTLTAHRALPERYHPIRPDSVL